MENLEQKKLDIIQGFLLLRDAQVVSAIESLIKESLQAEEEKRNAETIDTERFEEWNEQFENEALEMQDFLPEYETSLMEYRQRVWEAERSEEIPVETFFETLEQRNKWIQKEKLG